MYRELTRPLTDDERTTLEAVACPDRFSMSLTSTLKGVALSLVGLVLCSLAAFVVVRLNPGAVIGGMIGGLIVVTGIICLYLLILFISSHRHWSRIRRRFILDDIPRIRSEIADGRALVKHVQTENVIEVSEYEDEGPSYLFDVGDGQVLFIKGQHYYSVEDRMPWPNTDFELVRTARERLWIGVFCHGDELTPVEVIAGAEIRDEFVWETREELLQGTIKDIGDSLKRPADL